MIRCRHRREVRDKGTNTSKYEWCDAWLVSVLHHPRNGVVAVVAYSDDEWGSEQGMKIMAEETMSHVRIPRTRIPLNDPVPDGAAKILPDAAKPRPMWRGPQDDV